MLGTRTALRASFAAAAALAAGALAGCGGGGGGQNRPAVVSVFPADGTTLPGTIAYARVLYDERVSVLNGEGVRVAANVDGNDEKVRVEVRSDPLDDHAVLVFPIETGHFLPDTDFHLVVGQSTVVNDDLHYSLDEESVFFHTGAAPSFFVTTAAGSVHEVDRTTGALVQTTAPPAGYRAREPLGADARVWVWLDPIAPGPSVLGTFVPGAATIATTIALTGSIGPEAGEHLFLERDGRTVYATAFDPGRSQALVHRVDADGLAEIGSPVVLSTPVPSAADVFRPTIDRERHRFYVPTSNPAGGAFLSAIDLGAFQETDVGPLAGVDPLPVAGARGPVVWESARDVLYMIDVTSSFPAFVRIDADDLDVHPTSEPTLTGAPVALLVTGDGGTIVEGLSGYSGLDGLVETRAASLGDGFPLAVRDDVGGVLQGSTRVDVLLDDPFGQHFFAFASNGASSIMAEYEYEDGDLSQLDLDAGTADVQSVAVAVPGVVTGATSLTGARPPP